MFKFIYTSQTKLPMGNMGMMRAAFIQSFKDCSTSLLTISSMSAKMRRSSPLNSGEDQSEINKK